MAQDAPKNGTMFFQISTAQGRSTHVSVLDFTAAGGSVGLPSHVVASLWPSGMQQPGEKVTVTYRRLEKGMKFSWLCKSCHECSKGGVYCNAHKVLKDVCAP